VSLAARAIALWLVALPAGGASVPELSGPALDYALHCQGCHRSSGEATEGRVPALAGRVGRFLSSRESRARLVRIAGVRNAPLTDAELARLLNWLFPAFDSAHTPRDFAPFTAEEVATHRRAGRPER
jgi:hypothetical protein